MTFGELTRHTGCLLFVHSVHVIVLLLPTYLLAGPDGMAWPTGCFALCIMAAAMLEGLCVAQHRQVISTEVQDKQAVRVALLVGICLLAAFWSAQIERLALGPSSLIIHALGASFVLIGIALRVAAIRALGPRFVSDICVGRSMVRDGIYAWMRHPSEIGLLLLATGGPLLIGAPLTAGAAVIMLLPISRWRMQRENTAWAA